jgi:hypothetical protein
MADKKISALTAASTPLAGTEVLPIVQGGSTVKVSAANLTAGRATAVGSLVSSGTVSATGSAEGANFSGLQVDNSSAGSGSPANTVSLNFANFSVVKGRITAAVYGDGYMDFATDNDTAKMRITAGGGIINNLGNFVLGTAGRGIDFSANGGDILSQYDEGSWTVKLFDSAGGGNQSATTVTGYYTRVGNLVQCSFWGLNNISTAGMTAGNNLFIELPFTASATGSGTGSFASENITFNGRANATPAVPVSNNRAILRAYGTGTSTATVLVSNVGAGANIDYFSMTYRV